MEIVLENPVMKATRLGNYKINPSFADQAENEISGVNLTNYLPYQRNFDTVLYVHKRVLKKKDADKTEAKNNRKVTKDKGDSKTERGRNESVLQQTVRFAKHIAPVMIPPCDSAPVFYTVETCSKCRKTSKKDEQKQSNNDATYDNYTKRVIETYRKDKKRKNKSTSDSVTSQSNTLDDVNINQSLSCTMSDQSDKKEKYVKNEVNYKRKRTKGKFVISDSFEAAANNITDADDAKIKVQLMNNAERNAFCDNIVSPILDSVKEYLSEFHRDVREEVKTVQKNVKFNTDKLDRIIDRIAKIEKRLEKRSPRTQTVNASTLEQLGEDIDETDDFNVHDDNRVTDLGCGEIMRPSSSVGVKTDRLSKIPARFCWTDADKD